MEAWKDVNWFKMAIVLVIGAVITVIAALIIENVFFGIAAGFCLGVSLTILGCEIILLKR